MFLGRRWRRCHEFRDWDLHKPHLVSCIYFHVWLIISRMEGETVQWTWKQGCSPYYLRAIFLGRRWRWCHELGHRSVHQPHVRPLHPHALGLLCSWSQVMLTKVDKFDQISHFQPNVLLHPHTLEARVDNYLDLYHNGQMVNITACLESITV